MKMQKYIVDEDRLLELLTAELELECLEAGGVDNWQWYGEGKQEFLLEAVDGRIPEEEIPDYLNYDDIAKLDLETYENIYKKYNI